jgi:cytochrome c-type biogenesis protein CcmH/NrfG
MELLGIQSHRKGEYQDAIGYWQRARQALPPEDSRQAHYQAAIEMARKQLSGKEE